jgi:hypothetical protein
VADKNSLFNGGLVTSRDPSTLRNDDRLGELSRADDAEYYPDDPGIWPIAGRTAFNSTAEAAPIKSGGFFEFDPDISRFIVLVGATSGASSTAPKYRIATAAATGTFTDLLTGLGATTVRFDQANLGNQHLLFDGVNRNRIISSDLTTMPQGMLANTTAPAVTSEGIGPGITLASGSFIEHWVEERVKSGTTIVRRNAASSTTKVRHNGPSSDVKLRITRPAIVNTDATHWALFGTATNGEFPVGAEIGEVAIATTFIDETRSGSAPALPTGAIYPTVAVELNGVAVTSPKYGQPPTSSTGDVFEGSVVQNDVDNPSHVRFTFPDDIHAHPAINLANVRTKFKDRVVWIRTLGRSCIVGLANSLHRIDTLPLPEDAGFQPDRIRMEIEGAFGGVSPLAVAKFSFGQGSLIAYVSPHGVLVTDGTAWDVLTADLDWENTVDVAALPNFILVNNPRRYRLEFYYTPKGGSANTRALYFHYHPSHVKSNPGGGLRAKITGPIHAAAAGAFVASLAAGPADFYTFTCNADGKLYREGVGSTDASDAGGILFDVRTGDLYLNGIGGEATFRRGWLHHSAGASNQTATASQTMLAEGEDALTLTETVDVSRREATGVYQEGIADAFQFGVQMANPSQRVRIDYLSIEYDSAGEEQSP